MKKHTMVLLAACALAATGCSESKDWDHEVILQLFKSSAVGSIEIHAVQNKTSGKVDIEDVDTFFASCDNNQVRIISQTGDDDMDVIAVTVSGEGFQTVTQDIVNLDKVKIVIGDNTAALVPSCSTTPPPIDAAVDAPPKANGAACKESSECLGEVCLETFMIGGVGKEMPNGYCTERCTDDSEGCTCRAETDGNGPTDDAYCIVTCESSADCRKGYKCTTNLNCFRCDVTDPECNR